MEKIYVVEDDDDIRAIVEYILFEDGYLIRTFPNAKSFLAAFKSPYPDLLLIDVRLPDGDGRELCKLVKKDSKTNAIPVLLMSAQVNIEGIDNYFCGDGFVSKPFDIMYLRQIIKDKLSSNWKWDKLKSLKQ